MLVLDDAGWLAFRSFLLSSPPASSAVPEAAARGHVICHVQCLLTVTPSTVSHSQTKRLSAPTGLHWRGVCPRGRHGPSTCLAHGHGSASQSYRVNALHELSLPRCHHPHSSIARAGTHLRSEFGVPSHVRGQTRVARAATSAVWLAPHTRQLHPAVAPRYASRSSRSMQSLHVGYKVHTRQSPETTAGARSLAQGLLQYSQE